MQNKILEKKLIQVKKISRRQWKKMRKELEKPKVRAIFLRLKDK